MCRFAMNVIGVFIVLVQTCIKKYSLFELERVWISRLLILTLHVKICTSFDSDI